MRLPSVISAVVCAALLSQLAACGTLLYPERRGQLAGKIDPAVAGMNAIGVLFFVIPGLIAFAIDFASGAIYLPGGKYSVAPELLKQSLKADGSIDLERLKHEVYQATGHTLPLDDPRLVSTPKAPQELAHWLYVPQA